jgi:hypothetical protein
MSVIVMGMEMPKSCRECCLEAEGYFCMPIEVQNKDNDVWLRTQYWGDIGERPDWCPIRPLPEKHGRIVDVGPLEVVAYNQKDHEGESFDDGVVFMLEKMDALPTIVEAEGE